MPLKRHHKILIGSFTSIVIIFMFTTSIFLYLLYVKTNLNYQNLNDKVAETDAKINDLSDGLLKTNNLIDSELGSLSKEFNLLKASVGEDFSGIIDDSVNSVVRIKTNSGQGTGFIITSEGYIVTNAHVVANSEGNLASGIQVITSDLNARSATFIGNDADLDIALLKISGTWDTLKFGNSENVNVGEEVIVLGYPLGLPFSASKGVVSSVHGKTGDGMGGYIGTDSALNPGNSGGPLINKEGEVIGMNTFKISGSENLGFALESNYIIESVNDISQQELNQILIN